MVDLADAAAVAILTRAPSAGGKTRIFRSLGSAPDPALLAALLLDTTDAAAIPGVAVAVCVEPASACDEVRRLVPGVDVLPQHAGTLGDRMAHAFDLLLSRGASAVVLIGSDLPDLPPAVIVQAFETLRRDPDGVVLGPALDGGYYLVGATRIPPLFDGIAWGTAAVLEQTLTIAAARGVRVHQLPAIGDVDDVEALLGVSAPRTRAWLKLNNFISGT